MTDKLDNDVRDNPERSRYEAVHDGEVIGFAEYDKTEDVVVFTHTVVDSGYEGKGVAGQLVRFALDAVRDEGTREVVPQCSYVKGWIAKHPDYIPLVYGEAAPAAD